MKSTAVISTNEYIGTTITEDDIFELDDSYVGEYVYIGDSIEQLNSRIKARDQRILTGFNSDSNLKYQTIAWWKYAYPVNGNHKKTINKNNASNSTIKTIMTNFKSIIKELTRTEPEKTFIEAGFMDSDENLTATGREALESILVKSHATELLTLATQVKAYNDSKKA